MNVAQQTPQHSTRLPEAVYAERRRNVALGILAFIALLWVAIASPAPVETEIVTVTVHAGDSLWTLAEEYAPENQDPRDWIYDVRQMNNLKTADLWPGMQLTVATPVQ